MKAVLGKTILIRPVAARSAPASGLLISYKASSRLVYQEGRVVHIGTDVSPEILKIGDRVMYNRLSGHDLHINGDILRAVQERDCAFVLDEEDNIA